MADLARLAGCSVGITTNGTLIDGAVARQLAETMDVVGISLDGASAATYEGIRPGASFDGVVSGIRELVAARRRSRRGGLPLISLLFLKQRQNIADLPAMVELAADLGVDEVIASNLTFVARPAFFSRRVYALGAPDPADEMSLERARQRARKLSVGLKLYPLSPRRVPFCEALPHRALHITWNGFVSPCVYLGLPLKTTTLTRVYEGRLLEVPVIRFGNVSTTSLTDIWDGEAYRRFREPFAGRAGCCGDVDVGITPDGGFDELDPAIFRTLSSHPLPAVCQGCYKALGI
jgi:MoaA/NifB/PqqE/SkfB family radical SAM enzyme